MHKADRRRRRLEIGEHDLQRLSRKSLSRLVGEHTRQPDPGNCGIDGRLGRIDRQPRVERRSDF